ncbi:nucleotide-diphospho-sugar transferase [Mycotypha africana]|uniref:nucleotide-diphospho-sugar transferase n=1 Tax=Mycotypha africana TaxID=64632 RepID=UPI0023004A7E|nr:nucleotide-diphospho-sugar transferase [Mycotypha africana]KAI8975731.1 nucleotide-diphospho-sugar transferase [Mycotypha africana]
MVAAARSGNTIFRRFALPFLLVFLFVWFLYNFNTPPVVQNVEKAAISIPEQSIETLTTTVTDYVMATRTITEMIVETTTSVDVEQQEEVVLTNNKKLEQKGISTATSNDEEPYQREKACFVILARNTDRAGIRSAIQMIEDRFNHKYHYPYVFLNDVPFHQDFIDYTTALASGETFYGLVEEDMWGYPDWVDQDKAWELRDKMGELDIPYGDSESYRHMCRFQSGFFFRHPLLDNYDYYWRVEPDIHFTCDIDYDPFRFMRENDLKYSFTITLLEFEETIETLWDTTKEFIKKYPEYIIPFNSSDSFISWISPDNGESYNLCHFWSNFEIGSLNWLRSDAYLTFFNHLDKTGGFFYERWGDAPVHSIAAALMLRKSEMHFFYDMGYFHDHVTHCPDEPAWLPIEKCSCDPADSIDDDRLYSCTAEWLDVLERKRTTLLLHNEFPSLRTFLTSKGLNLFTANLHPIIILSFVLQTRA